MRFFATKKKFLANLRTILWPIEGKEMKLFLPMALMMLCILFNFGALRSIKDSLVVPNIGAESISFLKLWLVLPTTVIFTLIYIKLSNILNYEHLFYLIVSFFLGFFIFFTYVLYPGQEYYHPDPARIFELSELYPNFKWFIFIFGKWSYALMYIFSELWSVIIINLLFWQYANHIFDTKSARRFYPTLGVVGNVGLIFAGNVLVFFSGAPVVIDGETLLALPDLKYQSEQVLRPVMNVIIVLGVVAMMLYRYINKYVLKQSQLSSKFHNNIEDTTTKLSFLDSIKLIASSKYIGHIVLLIICYGLLINILEGPWKSRVRELYPNTIDYMNFMGRFNIWMGVSCVTFMVIGSNILRHFSWLTAALITPVMIAFTGVLFFVFVIFANDINFFGGLVHPIYFAVLIGAAQNILSKATKYSLFDTTKEMAYIPLSLELRTKGKAAVEVIGLKFGKSLGAVIQSFVFILLPTATFHSMTVYLLMVFIVVIILWMWNVTVLNKEYLKLRGDDNESA